MDGYIADELAEARKAVIMEFMPEAHRIFLDKMFDPLKGIVQRTTRVIEKFVGFLRNKPSEITAPIARGYKPLQFWLYVLLYEGLIFLLAFSISVILGEFQGIIIQIISLVFFDLLISFCFIVLIKLYFDKFRGQFLLDWIDYVNSITSLNEIKSWFIHIADTRSPFLWGLLFSIAWAVLGPYLFYQIYGRFVGWGPWVVMVLANFPIGTGGFYLIVSRDFRVQAKSWDFRIYEPNPSKSIIIMKLSKMLSDPVKIVAILSTLTTLAFSIASSFTWFILVIIFVIGWYPMISLFVRNQIALASIIKRAKQEKLLELQNKIIEYEREGLNSTDRIEYLQKLIDYHDRIENTPNTAMNFRVIFALLNSLLLPLMTFIITNLTILNNIIKLFFKLFQ